MVRQGTIAVTKPFFPRLMKMLLPASLYLPIIGTLNLEGVARARFTALHLGKAATTTPVPFLPQN